MIASPKIRINLSNHCLKKNPQKPEYIRLNSGRNHYQIAVRYMRRMKKLGGSEAVHALIVRLNQEFSKRKSLLEELERV